MFLKPQCIFIIFHFNPLSHPSTSWFIKLKNKLVSCLTNKWVYLDIAENCNLGKASYGKTIGTSGEQKTGTFSYRGKREWECCYKQKLHWNKQRPRIGVAFHWLSCKSPIGWAVAGREEKHFSLLLG